MAGLAALLLAGAAAAFAAGAVLDLSRWRDVVAQRASAAVGRPVVLRGRLQLQLGRELVLRVGDVQLPNPPGFEAPWFLSLGDTRLRVDLLDALRGRLAMRGVEARDIGLWLERTADSRGNWSGVPAGEAAPPGGVDLGPILLRNVAIHVHDLRSTTRRTFELQTLHGHAAPDQPLRLALRGRDETGAPYRLEIEGGTLRQLMDGSAPWPFRLDAGGAHAWLHAAGEWHPGKGEARVDFDTHADDLERAGAPWGLALPGSVAAALRGRVMASARTIDLTIVQGRLDAAKVAGHLMLDRVGSRAQLKGHLDIDELDLRPWLTADAPPRSTGWGDLLRQPVPRFERLPLDLDLRLQVRRWSGLPAELRDLRLGLQADARGLRAPLRALFAHGEVSGQLDLQASTPAPRLDLQLTGRDLAFEDPPARPSAAPTLEGRLRHAELRLGGHGDTWGALLQDLEMSLTGSALRMQRRDASGARTVDIAIDRVVLTARRDERLQGSAIGTLNGERAHLGLRAGTWHELLRERALPLEAELSMASSTLRATTVIAPASDTRDAELRLDLQARRVGDLARWLPVSPHSSLPLALRARVRVADDAWAVDAATLQLGRSDLQVDAQRQLVGGRPLTTARLRSRLIDAAQLSTLRAGAMQASGGTPGLADVELDVQVQQLLLGHTELQDVTLTARTQDGRLEPFTASGRVAGATFAARAKLEPAGDTPVVKLDLSTGAIDLGALLRGLGVAQDIDGQVDGMRLTLVGRGSSPGEWAKHTDLEASLAGGRITVQGAAERPVAEIGVKHAFIGATAGEPIRGRLLGTIDEVPLRIDLATGSFADFARDASRLPFTMTARAAGSRLSLDGEVALPLGSEGQLVFDVGGERLDTLSGLARVELPAWGPWSLRGPIRMTPDGYDMQGLDLGVGQSRLGGSGKLDLSGPRPRLQMQVAARRIQLGDFPLPERLTDAEAPGTGGDGLRNSASRLAGRADRLLSANFLRRFDASIDVQAQEVLSGNDLLADGHLHLELQQGRLRLDPAVVNVPGGSLRLSMGYDLKESQLDFEMAAAVNRFDYGIIARRRHPAANLRGLFSLDMEIKGTAPSLDKILPRASGHLDFAVWPTELRSGVFNLWSANLVLTLLPLIDPGGSPQINCIVGRFDMQDGKLDGETMLIDTTSVRIRGVGQADLNTEQLGFVFRPRAKGVGLLRLQTPLRVGGTLYDQRFYFNQSDVLESVLRLIASPILLPIERLRYGPQARDGADVCTDPLRAAAG